MTRKVEVVPHDHYWQNLFEDEYRQLSIALGSNAISIHHIGSTAISTIHAKPIIDILIEVENMHQVADQNPEIISLGYIAMGEFGIAGRRFFRKDNSQGIRTHHIHTFKAGSVQIVRHLAFRDYLRSHPERAQEYSRLKQKLAQQYPTDIEGYMAGKADFIQAIDKLALE